MPDITPSQLPESDEESLNQSLMDVLEIEPEVNDKELPPNPYVIYTMSMLALFGKTIPIAANFQAAAEIIEWFSQYIDQPIHGTVSLLGASVRATTVLNVECVVFQLLPSMLVKGTTRYESARKNSISWLTSGRNSPFTDDQLAISHLPVYYVGRDKYGQSQYVRESKRSWSQWLYNQYDSTYQALPVDDSLERKEITASQQAVFYKLDRQSIAISHPLYDIDGDVYFVLPHTNIVKGNPSGFLTAADTISFEPMTKLQRARVTMHGEIKIVVATSNMLEQLREVEGVIVQVDGIVYQACKLLQQDILFDNTPGLASGRDVMCQKISATLFASVSQNFPDGRIHYFGDEHLRHKRFVNPGCVQLLSRKKNFEKAEKIAATSVLPVDMEKGQAAVNDCVIALGDCSMNILFYGEKLVFPAYLESGNGTLFKGLLACFHGVLLTTVWITSIFGFSVFCQLIFQTTSIYVSMVFAVLTPYCFGLFSMTEMDKNIRNFFNSPTPLKNLGRRFYDQPFYFGVVLLQSLIGTFAYAAFSFYSAYNKLEMAKEQLPHACLDGINKIEIPLLILIVTLTWVNQMLTKGVANMDRAGFRSKPASENKDPLCQVFARYRSLCGTGELNDCMHVKFWIHFIAAILDTVNVVLSYYKGAVTFYMYCSGYDDEMSANLSWEANIGLFFVGVVGASLTYSFGTTKFLRKQCADTLERHDDQLEKPASLSHQNKQAFKEGFFGERQVEEVFDDAASLGSDQGMFEFN